jgi:hypothetical protein
VSNTLFCRTFMLSARNVTLEPSVVIRLDRDLNAPRCAFTAWS